MVLVAGEALIDMIPVSGVDGGACFQPIPGGSPYNVALALGRLGLGPYFLCAFAQDSFGEQLREHVAASGVDVSLCPIEDRLSTLGFVTQGSEGSPKYAFYTEGTTGCSLRPDQLPGVLPERVAAVHVGSFSLAVDPFGRALEALAQREAPRRVISVDPNIRDFLIRDRSEFEPRLERFLSAAHVIKLSDEDLAWLQPGQTPEAFAGPRLEQGAGLVVVTQGERGVWAQSRSAQVSVTAEPVSLVDTVGAGDTFQAALLAGLAERGLLNPEGVAGLDAPTLEALLRFASRAAAVTCGRRGCDPPRRAELGSAGDL